MPALKPLTGERQKGEAAKAVLACNDYLRMGPARSLAKLQQKYADSATENPPTIHLRTLSTWSSKFGWVDRAEAYDAEIEAIKTAKALKEMTSGLALDHERVEKLKAVFERLEKELEDGKLWLKDYKAIDKEAVEIKRYNTALINDLRGILDDLAKETGGRVKKSEHTGPEGGAIEISIIEPVRPDGE